MLRRSFVAVLLALPFGMVHAAAAVGQPAPDFSVRDANGQEVKLSQFRGKHVVLEWMNPGCPFVRKHYDSGNMAAVQKDALAKGVVWLSVYSNDDESWGYTKPAKLKDWLRERKASPTALLMDGSGAVGKAYGARTTPHMFLIGPTGTLVYAGAIDSIPSADKDDIAKATNYVRQAVSEAVAGKAVSTPSNRPYGCMIKYKSQGTGVRLGPAAVGSPGGITS
ncbi:thioredoxin family protein [Hydrogenophaga sp.]|uniref:thioredoxin family protein n=1 Tax=Hydrogenophaga sp. TaxID=1904254 RepID=UPI0025BE1127|nr:thioredoxin family protein [Hydrogenophaga sp.]